MNKTIGVDISKNQSRSLAPFQPQAHAVFERQGALGALPMARERADPRQLSRDGSLSSRSRGGALEGGTRAGQGQSLAGLPLRRQDRPRRRPDARAYVIDPSARADAGSQQEHARNQGTACRARGSDQGSHRLPERAGHRAQQGRRPPASGAGTSDRQADRPDRCRVGPPHRCRSRTDPAIRDPDAHARHRTGGSHRYEQIRRCGPR